MQRFRRHPRNRTALVLASALVGALACAEPPAEPPSAAALLSDGPHEVAVLTIQNMGEIHIELLPEIAPENVANFKNLIATGFYNGTLFHRVLPDFMIQGGDPLSKDRDPRNDGQGGRGHNTPDEYSALPHRRGTVAMANSGRHTASSQFFILKRDAPELDGQYSIFGRVIAGIDVVDHITELEIDKFGRWGPRDHPYPVQAIVEASRIEPAGVSAGPNANAGTAGSS